MTRPLHFRWRGEPITDIEQWADDRGELMVEFRAMLDVLDQDGTGFTMVHDEWTGACPETFWKGVTFTAPPWGSWRYVELARRAPKVEVRE